MTVVSNAKQREVVLRVEGFIIPDPSVLRKRLGQLRLTRAEFNFGNVFDTEVKTDSIVIKNVSNHDFELGIDLADKPSNIEIIVPELPLKPGEEGLVFAKVAGQVEGEYGFQRYRLKFWDKVYPDSTMGQFILTYNQQEDFTKLTESERRLAPRIEFKSKGYNFGKRVQGEKVECRYEFENKGKSMLKIRGLRLPTGVTAGEFKREIGAGEKGEIILVADTSRMSGELIRYIHITTNCPTSSKVRLSIKGKVIDKK